MAMTKIATVTVGAGGISSIVLGAGGTIPQTYTDLYLVLNLRSGFAGGNIDTFGYFNADQGGNYSRRRLYGIGSGTGSDTSNSETWGGFGQANATDATANNFGNTAIYIPNYTSSTAKSWSVDTVTEQNATGVLMEIEANIWTGTAAITTITLYPNGSSPNWLENSTATLYGILKGSSGGVTVS